VQRHRWFAYRHFYDLSLNPLLLAQIDRQGYAGDDSDNLLPGTDQAFSMDITAPVAQTTARKPARGSLADREISFILQ
jgi:hypothetical protein